MNLHKHLSFVLKIILKIFQAGSEVLPQTYHTL